LIGFLFCAFTPLLDNFVRVGDVTALLRVVRRVLLPDDLPPDPDDLPDELPPDDLPPDVRITLPLLPDGKLRGGDLSTCFMVGRFDGVFLANVALVVCFPDGFLAVTHPCGGIGLFPPIFLGGGGRLTIVFPRFVRGGLTLILLPLHTLYSGT